MNKCKEITLMSAFLCLSVIMIHITATPVTTLTWASAAHIFIFIVNRMLTFSVPAFLFLSGFKLYGKYGQRKMNLIEFFRGRLLKIVVPYLISVLVYFVCMYAVGWVTPDKLPEYVFLGTLAAHFYYIVIAVQLYILFPILKYVFDRYPILLTVLAFAATLYLNQFFYFTYSDRFFGTYIFYFVLGMLLARYRPYEKSRLFGIISVILMLGVGAAHIAEFYFAMWRNEIYTLAGTFNIVYFTLSIMALISISSWITKRWDIIYRCAGVLDGASYEIYLYHILLILLIQSGITPRLGLSVREQFVLSFVVIYSLCFIYAFVKNKILIYRKNKKTAV